MNGSRFVFIIYILMFVLRTSLKAGVMTISYSAGEQVNSFHKNSVLTKHSSLVVLTHTFINQSRTNGPLNAHLTIDQV